VVDELLPKGSKSAGRGSSNLEMSKGGASAEYVAIPCGEFLHTKNVHVLLETTERNIMY
jgi:hypothetical protein